MGGEVSFCMEGVLMVLNNGCCYKAVEQWLC